MHGWLLEFGNGAPQQAHLHLPVLAGSAPAEQGWILPHSAHPCSALAPSPPIPAPREPPQPPAAAVPTGGRHMELSLHPSSAPQLRGKQGVQPPRGSAMLLLPSEAFYGLVHGQC